MQLREKRLLMLQNSRLNRLRIRTHNLIDFLAILEQQESRHSPDPQILSYIRHFIHVDLVEAHVGVLFAVPVGFLSVSALRLW